MPSGFHKKLIFSNDLLRICSRKKSCQLFVTIFFKERKMRNGTLLLLVAFLTVGISAQAHIGADPLLDSHEQYFDTFEYQEPELTSEAPDELEMELFGSSESSPVWGTFIRNLGQCAPGCKPVNYNAYRSQRNSCHYTGRALDVGAIRCDGKTYQAISGGKYASMVQCMKRKMRVLYRNGPGRTSGHHDHAHFSLGCSIPGRPIYW